MIIGFTGTSKGMTPAQLVRVWRLFNDLPIHAFHHGDCVGADEQAHVLARAAKAWTVIHPPTDPKHRAFCPDWDELHKHYDYLTRNRHIVQAARDGVIAAPKDFVQPSNLRGQGTWTTIGYARQAGRRLWIVFPDGSVNEEPARGE